MKKYIYILAVLFSQCTTVNDLKTEQELNDYFEKKSDGAIYFEIDNGNLVSIFNRKNRLCTDKYIFDVREIKLLDNLEAMKTDEALQEKYDNLTFEEQEELKINKYSITAKSASQTITYIECYSNLLQNKPEQVLEVKLPVSNNDFVLIYNKLMDYKKSISN